MTRFEKELSGALGAYWKKEAEKELERVKKDLEEAVKWFAKAAERGNVEAMYYLGECYRDGSGVDEDQKKAVEWFTKAAKQGHEEAKAELEFYNRRESENAFEEDGFLPYSMVGSQNEDVTF